MRLSFILEEGGFILISIKYFQRLQRIKEIQTMKVEGNLKDFELSGRRD